MLWRCLLMTSWPCREQQKTVSSFHYWGHFILDLKLKIKIWPALIEFSEYVFKYMTTLSPLWHRNSIWHIILSVVLEKKSTTRLLLPVLLFVFFKAKQQRHYTFSNDIRFFELITQFHYNDPQNAFKKKNLNKCWGGIVAIPFLLNFKHSFINF